MKIKWIDRTAYSRGIKTEDMEEVKYIGLKYVSKILKEETDRYIKIFSIIDNI